MRTVEPPARRLRLALAFAGALGAPSLAAAVPPVPPVPLGLFFENGVSAPLTLDDNAPRYLDEIDVVASSEVSAEDRGIDPLIEGGDFAALDWYGVSLVEEVWSAAPDGTFTRERFYRNARWMERASSFLLIPADDAGLIAGTPFAAAAGADDGAGPLDDGFVRRFNARQTATGCPAPGNCVGPNVRFRAQGLAQLRYATHAGGQTQLIAPHATRLRLLWSEDPLRLRDVALARDDREGLGPGLSVELDEVSEPANGSFYQPGDTLQVRLTFKDGQGNRLHPPGSLPTYGQFWRGEIESGLRYVDMFRVSTFLYYALKHRESNILVALSGPVDRLRTPETVVDSATIFEPQVTFARSDVDGYSAVVQAVPSTAIVFGGAHDPACTDPPPPGSPPPPCLWDTPVSDVVTFTVPPDALPGTYLVATKARREFAGEPRREAGVLEVQVGSQQPTSFVPKTGNCQTCHDGATGFDNILHGLDDRRACFGCHASLGFELNNALDIRVHAVHDRSDRFAGDVHACGTCHLVPPQGPARGLLGP